ncbi:MAG: hypothetical protein EON61_15710 [Alphaproteobacteria bacterium]|jgi:hypothetical protein|nr:MAG: hypothetical protein EON61_15710 [Alphaproteobacteria bacterium]
MKRFIACLTLAALAAPAFAQQSSTLQELTTKGMVMEAGGMQIEVTYKPDGTFTAMDDQVTGKWRIDGDKLCTSSNFSPAEECVAYPTGKKSGDSFEVTSAQGAATIRIK